MGKMRKQFASALVVLLGVSLFSGFAATKKKPAAVPVPAAVVAPQPVKMIWDYKTQLALSDTQVNDIKGAINNFQQQVLQLRQKLQAVEGDIQDMIQKKADMNALQAKLNESAGIQVQLRVADIQTARTVDGVLTAEQTTKWKAIQKKEASRANRGTMAAPSTTTP